MLNINKDYLKSHKCYVGQNNPEYIVWHETDNYERGAGAVRHGMAHVNGNLGSASVHFFVDDSNIIQTLNFEDGSWAIGDGDGSSGITNYNSINIEVCVNEDSNYDKAWYNAVDLVRYLMQELNISGDNVKTHNDATGKWCPRISLSNKWVGCFIDYINNPSKQTPTSPQDNIPQDFNYIAYLQKNAPDIIGCICSGGFNSGCDPNKIRNAAIKHYLEFGIKEDRIYK